MSKRGQHDVFLKVRLWFESDRGPLLGPGRLALLEGVRRLGSLNKAAAEMGMSYRRAWGRVKEAEKRLGDALVVDAGGRNGFRLTPLADRLVDDYVAWMTEVKSFALERAQVRFPWHVETRPEAGVAPGAADAG
ncbi:MAG: winged helix-turn-helix domain-containing protein [Desulfovibrionaceae bacterium]